MNRPLRYLSVVEISVNEGLWLGSVCQHLQMRDAKLFGQLSGSSGRNC